MSRPNPLHRRIAAGAVAVAIVAVGAFFVPEPAVLSDEQTGDAQLADRLQTLLKDSGGVRHEVSAVVIDDEGTRFAGLGADESTEFEIGSVTKTFTARLLAIAVEEGEVQLTTPLGDLLDLGDSPAAEVTLEELSTHTSGLPRLPGGVAMFARSWWSQISADDPYGGSSLDDLVSAAKGVELSERGTVAYSNFGLALLGQALASAASTDYATLLDERIFGPLQMADSYDPVSSDGLRDGAPTGFTETGRPADAWTMGSYGPAGSIRSTNADLVRYVEAMLDDDLGVMEPRVDDESGNGVGLAWFTTDVDGVDITWHNGGTGGYRSMVALDREAGRAAIVLSDTAVPVDDLAIALLEEEPS